MSENPPVRLLGAEDAAAAARLHAACFEGAEQWNAWSFRDTLALTTTLALGIEQDGRLTGLIVIQKVRPDAEILTIAVDPQHRRQGHAATLLKRACDLLGPYGIDRLLLDVAEDNTAAASFYRAHAFRMDGRRSHYYQRGPGGAVDALLMSRPVAGHTGDSGA